MVAMHRRDVESFMEQSPRLWLDLVESVGVTKSRQKGVSNISFLKMVARLTNKLTRRMGWYECNIG